MVKYCPVLPWPKTTGFLREVGKCCLEDECVWWTGKECAIVTIAKGLQGKP